MNKEAELSDPVVRTYLVKRVLAKPATHTKKSELIKVNIRHKHDIDLKYFKYNPVYHTLICF